MGYVCRGWTRVLWALGIAVIGLGGVPAIAGAQALPSQPKSEPIAAEQAAPAQQALAPATQTAARGASIRVQGTVTTAAQPSSAAVLAATAPPLPGEPSVAPGSAAGSGASQSASAGAPASVAPATKPVLKGLGEGGISTAAQKLNPLMMRALKQFEVAKASFTGFCEDWHRKLAAREVDNLAHISWKAQNGVETGSYVSYGPIESCTCKQASNGVPIGELTYKEMDNTLSGKTVDEAKHAKPAVTIVPTREIFSWDKGKWFY